MKATKRLSLLGGAILLVGTGTFWWFTKEANTPLMTTATLHPVSVSLAPVKEGVIPNRINATATLSAARLSHIAARTDGHVEKIFFHDGELVQPGQVLLQFDNRKEKSAVDNCKAKLEISQQQFERNSQLFKKRLITQDTYFKAKAHHDAMQAELTSHLTELDDKTVRAPFAGFVHGKPLAVGDYISAGTPLLTLVDISHLWVQYKLPSRFLSQLKLGQAITVHSAAFPDMSFHGKVTFIASYLDAEAQTVVIKGLLDNTDAVLKPGLFVQIEQQLGDDKQAIVVPADSVIASLHGYHVYTVRNRHAVRIPVEVGSRFRNQIEITKGLAPGAKIVVSGQHQLKDHEKVLVKAS